MQRVTIGRAIVREPRIFLMDEPLSNLDFKLREALRVELQHIQKTQGITTLFVTHDQVEALTMADRIAVLNRGKIIQIGSSHDIYDRPANIYVAQLVGTPRINLMGAKRENGFLHVDEAPIRLPLGEHESHVPENCQLGVRPEDIEPVADGQFDGEITLTEPLGVETVVHIRSGTQTLLSTTSGIAAWRIGEKVKFTITRERLHFFDSEGHRV
jgi:ABC-type sugar transport system ATPase subunit